MSDEEQPKVSGRPGGGAYPRGEADYLKALSAGREKGPADDPAVSEMRKNRRINARTASHARGGAEVSFASGRPRDPMFYWKQNNLPFDYSKPDELAKIRSYCRVIYATHPVIASAIDVYAKYPLAGMELTCKDEALTEFYTDLFFDQLDYEDFLTDVGREYWTVGEACPLGSFNETLGVWEDDELINPDDVEVTRSPFLREPRLEMRLPETLRRIIETREPAWEFQALMRSYPELKHFTSDEARMPVSGVLLKHLRFKADTFSTRGLPILMRGFRAVMQEEMLNAAQDAIADRLYTPLVLAKLGASATDLGTTQPWIPTEDDLADFEEALDAALAGDFRVLTHHFAVQMTSVFGRENMPNMTQDFERLTDRQLQVFGLSRTMLTGAGQGETYAADSINRDVVSQLLSGYQRLVKRFFRDRALVVAEAQEHYDYEERGGKRYPIMEEVLEVDEETGEQRIVEQPKLLVPDLNIKAMTMKDEADQRQFFEALAAGGVPISMKTRMVNVPIDLDEERQTVRDEVIASAVEAQETRKATYEALRARGLPIPADLKDDFEPKASVAGGAPTKAEEEPIEGMGTVEPAPTGAIEAPNAPSNAQEGAEQGDGATVVSLPTNRLLERTRPPESDEERARMPKPAVVRKVATNTVTDEETGEETTSTEERWEEVDLTEGDEDGYEVKAANLLSGPRHVGLRRQAGITKDTELPSYSHIRRTGSDVEPA